MSENSVDYLTVHCQPHFNTGTVAFLFCRGRDVDLLCEMSLLTDSLGVNKSGFLLLFITVFLVRVDFGHQLVKVGIRTQRSL